MNYSASSISTIINGKTHNNGDSNAIIKTLLIDSRKLSNAETYLFFAIKGERHDGHTYLNDLYEKGVRNFVISSLPPNSTAFANAN